MVTVESRDGVRLHGALYRPEGEGPCPTVVSVYGGPHAQRVTNGWGMTADLQAQYLRQLGFAVFKLDNRGSARRGLAFEGALKHNMGDVEVRDQIDGVRWLVEQGITDPERVGVTGWSYGGYMTLMCLLRAPETFQVGVAGAPVTHWDGYDTHYTERYMGLPEVNPAGYEESSPLNHVEALTGKLLIVHGLIDENVHFRHTARLVNALIRARKYYDLLLFPDERHMPRGLADRIYMHERIFNFFVENL
jgi:dipeptidyl-peptidase-4